MKRKTISIVLAAALLLTMGLATTLPVGAATEEDIEDAIERGVAWLAGQQTGDGSWPTEGWFDPVATTGFAVLKLEDRAYELGYDSPFDEDYPYHEEVIDGLDYLFGRMNVIAISLQDHTGGASGTNDDPDSNSNGTGIYAHGHYYPFDVYDTGIALSAIAASRTPTRTVGALGSPVDGWTYMQVAQDMVDWLAWAQSDYDYANFGAGEGGWTYAALDNDDQWGSYGPDNSNGGYATLGLAYGKDFGCTIPEWVMIELNAYIEDNQDPVDGDVNGYDGGSWYDCPGGTGILPNILKTGNLIFEMAMVGDTPTTPRVIDAVDYLVRHWGDASGANWPPGWDGNPAQYQAMFCAMKGLAYMGIDMIDGIDWYQDFADAIITQQVTTPGPLYGSWQSSSGRGIPVAITAWALLTLEKTAPPPAVIVDIKPMSLPNPLNVNGKGVLPVAILGTEEFDVNQIDPATILLEGEAPLRWALEDVGALGDSLAGPDGIMDLSLKFDAQAIVAALGPVNDGDYVVLHLTGNLKPEFDGTPISGQDVVRIIKKK